MRARLQMSLVSAAMLLFGASQVTAQEVGGQQQELRGTRVDGGSPRHNATVYVAFARCTGVLVRTDLVLTAGHCIRQHAGRRTGQWYPRLEPSGDTVFGQDRTRPELVAQATHYNLIDGADLAFLALREPVPSSVATAAPLLTAEPRGVDWGRQSFRQAGWGPRTVGGPVPDLRGAGSGRSGRFCGANRNYLKVLFCIEGADIIPGDSGGPLYWTGPDGVERVIGIARTAPDIYTSTFSDVMVSDRNPERSNLSRYTTSLVATSACSQLRAQEQATSPVLLLMGWYSPGRSDNVTTTHPSWIGCEGDARTPDYDFSRAHGLVFSPERPQPEGTIPLYRWYSPSRGDNHTTTHPSWRGGPGQTRSPDYHFSRLVGYIYPPERGPRPDLLPLYRWYSPSRGDNYTTTHPSWHGGPGENRSPDYHFSQIEGYILNAGRGPSGQFQ